MMLNRIQAAVFAAMVVLLMSAVASAGSVSVEINANTNDLAGLVEYDSQAFGAVLNLGGGFIYSDSDYTLGDLHIALKDEIFHPALTLGLGFKGLVGQAEISSETYDVAAIGFKLLGEWDFRKIYINFPILIFADFSGSPDPLSFRDTTGYMDFNMGIRAYLVRSAAVVAGYRVLNIDFKDKDTSDTLNDDAWYIGLRLTF